MGNSPLAGQGVNEPHDQRDVDGIESLGARPQETKTKIDEALDPRYPQAYQGVFYTLHRITGELISYFKAVSVRLEFQRMLAT